MNNTSHKLQPEKWAKSYADYMINYTYSRISHYESAKDIVQETFLSALKAMPNYRGDANERTWLIAILKRKIIDYYRKNNSFKGQAEVHMSFYEDGDKKGSWIEERVPQEWEYEEEKIIENEELRKIIDLCIDFLPLKYAEAFKLKTILNMDTNDVCKDLDISSSNLWVMIHRARLQLRECLEENWFNK